MKVQCDYSALVELTEIGFKGPLLGTQMLADCLALIRKHKGVIPLGNVYNALAIKYNGSYKTAERNLRYALYRYYEREGLERVTNTVGIATLYNRIYGGEVQPCALRRQVK